MRAPNRQVGQLWQDLTLAPLNQAAWQDLLQIYAAADLAWQEAYVRQQLSRLARRSPTGSGDVAAAAVPDLHGPWGRTDVAEGEAQALRLEAWLAQQPGDWLTWLVLVRLHDVLRAPASRREPAWAQAQALEFIPGESAHLLGGWCLAVGDAAGAVAAMASLVDLRPVRHGSMVRLGQALLRLGQLRAAEVVLTRASLSDSPKVLAWLAEVAFQHNYWQEAIAALQKAVHLSPDDASLWLALAHIQSKCYQMGACRDSLARVLRVAPDNADARSLQIGLLGQLGDAAGYFEALQKQYSASGAGNSRLLSSVLMTSLYQDDLGPDAVARLHRSLMAPLEVKQSPWRPGHRRQRAPGQALRLAYVSGDLHRQHPVNIFLLPLLLEQKKSDRLEIFIFHTGTMHDQYTARARECADVWVEAAAWDDETLRREIEAHDVDVLIDLAGHTATHRLGVFLQRAAPVQATFLGYPHSTGLKNIDFLIGDAVVSPDANAHLFSERVARLPGPVFCWAPVDDYPLPTAVRSTGPVVFGSFNNALKLSPRTIAIWAKVLSTVPNSMLLLKAPSFMNADVTDRFRLLFEANGVAGDRLVFRGPSELSVMMQEYGDVDIALDPLPYNGGTTSLQALWMGVPVISMEGATFQNRMGASFLKCLGREEWLAQDEGEYVAIAQRLAQQVEYFRSNRPLLREQLRQSALGDIVQYAADFEALVFQIAAESDVDHK